MLSWSSSCCVVVKNTFLPSAEAAWKVAFRRLAPAMHIWHSSWEGLETGTVSNHSPSPPSLSSLHDGASECTALVPQLTRA